MFTAYMATTIREAEKPLIHPDDRLMRTAAHAVADHIAACVRADATILILAGIGGNGGDGLYAGVDLIKRGYDRICAYMPDEAYLPALTAFTEAGGSIIGDLDKITPDLIVDALVGLGCHSGIDPKIDNFIAHNQNAVIVSVDIPSGIDADTGVAFSPHIRADHTISFGAARGAHLISPHCGTISIAPIGIEDHLHTPLGYLSHSITADGKIGVRGADFDAHRVIPGPLDHKYSGGVVGIIAGSPTYPGAAVLATTAGVQATSSMVRYLGPCANEVIALNPEVVCQDGAVDAWVIGPGGAGAADIENILGSPCPVILDAGALTTLAQSELLRSQLIARTDPTVLTPHHGEFETLARNFCTESLATGGLGAIQELADHMGHTLVVKGRKTVICTGSRDAVIAIDSGHSWLATPGTGDLLAGMMGAWVAHHQARQLNINLAIPLSVHILNIAGFLAAQTTYGAAPTSASAVARKIPEATAAILYTKKL
ncbi:bifunctional ADP-dependent NAD(P)H-hydrate dehydratase/NAD(P)H-hydrate epimerase [Corynebacterium sp. ES2775-CONJ]|uniref:bifunctional ADP-dependent NAD(P)H-hydrate dehydratase/NAD(P)H-hydrate epimerase n=1 Tax=Corynebacterium sp. ES2775-CONJ TaxID=2974029 RepID=UPI002167D70A|nr:bifunctional ADP-dependent NAD(P)H-hydrate dehydratase/NAD(P)H-hydrate epimerase [Corynebacterium sp. ES2775-CONJ]MCS4490487.1 bifunctional ADP-dependent NAD(P)H-hydrate dehydratase/NAD(P)H-hydrate epimerase [Corynebacterium sp. ES2775-CONJ]